MAGLSSPTATCQRRARRSVTRRSSLEPRAIAGAEAWLLHDIARVGDAASVAGRLGELAGICEGELVAAYAMHADASASGRTEGLIDAADKFESLGALLLAAEAAAEAAQALQHSGDRRASAAMSVRASTLAESCEGARHAGPHDPRDGDAPHSA